jgi:hypothetical protein
LPGYILPIFPALAIILGVEAECIWNGERTRLAHSHLAQAVVLVQATVFLTFALLLALGIGAGIYLHRKGGVLESGALTALLGLVLVAVLIAASWRILGKSRAAIVSPLAVMPCIILVAMTVLLPRIYESLSIKPLTLQIDDALQPEEDLILFHNDRQYTPVFYNEGRVEFYQGGPLMQGQPRPDKLDEETAAQLIEALKREQREGQPSAIVIALPGRRNDLQRDPRFHTEPVGQQDKVAALRVRLNATTIQPAESQP